MLEFRERASFPSYIVEAISFPGQKSKQKKVTFPLGHDYLESLW
jgi:hypothetical protein